MLQGRARARGIVDAEHDRIRARVRELAHLRVVAVHRQRGLLRQRAHGRPPPCGHVLELPVAVELVAEEIAQTDSARPHPRRHLGQRGLVHLEQAELGAPRVEQRRGDPGDEVRTRAIVREPQTVAQDLRSHRGGRRLAVRRRDQGRPEGEPRREPVDCAGVQFPDQLAGDGRAAARAREPRKAAGDTRERDLGGKRNGHAHDTTEAIRAPLVTRTREFRRPYRERVTKTSGRLPRFCPVNCGSRGAG